MNCECVVAVNLLCGGCLWYHTDHVKYRLLFWFVLHGHESVKELTRAGKKGITLSKAQMEATQGPKESVRSELTERAWFSAGKKKCKCNNSVFGDWWIMQRWLMYFLLSPLISLRGKKTWGAEVFLLLVCEWVGGVPPGEESRIEVNAGESFLFFIYTWWDLQSPAGVGGKFCLKSYVQIRNGYS